MKRSIRFLTLASPIALPLLLGSFGLFPTPAAGADGDETDALLEQLESTDTTVFEKAKACQQLAVKGDASAAPALAKLLESKQLAGYARSALEAMQSPEATAALRDAMPKLNDELLVGVINSLGILRDDKALAQLVERLAEQDSAVAAAAARAIGRIGNLESAGHLKKALDNASPQQKDALAGACLICGQQLIKDGKRGAAVELFELVRASTAAEHMRSAATRGAILAQGTDGLPLLEELLASEKNQDFELALQTSRVMKADATPLLVAQFADQSPQRQAMLVLAMGDLGNAESFPTILEAVGASDPEVRIQAIRALGDLRLAQATESLIDAALEDDDRLANAARESLARLEGEEVDRTILERLAKDKSSEQAVAIELARDRRIAEATPALLSIVGSDTGKLRLAAIRALGATVQLEHLPLLLDLAEHPKTEQEGTVARSAARAACVRMPREECARLLAGRLAAAGDDSRALLLEQLGLVGGPTALDAVVEVAQRGNDAGQDAATRVLGEWLSADAAPEMFELAKSIESDKYKVRVLRGYLRLARQLDMPTSDRIQVCRNALVLAERDDERRLVLDVLRRHRDPAGFPIALELLESPVLREPACSTILAIAASHAEKAPETAIEALQKVAESTRRPEIRRQANELAEGLRP